MRFKTLQETCKFLGPMYSIKVIDGAESIFREIDDRFEFEVCGFFSGKTLTVNLWQRKPHTELMAIYSGIAITEDLADTLGYLAFKYKNLQERIQVEREDLPQ